MPPNPEHYRRKAILIEQLGGVCNHCGTDSQLQFDHIVPSTKLFDVTQGLAGRNWESVQREVKKCQLLCRSCHMKKSRMFDEIGGNRKLNRMQVRDIRWRVSQGEPLASVAKRHGCSVPNVSMIVNRKRWAHVK
jgi:5-methylcytosine-specific restriction endonuclease McrA